MFPKQYNQINTMTWYVDINTTKEYDENKRLQAGDTGLKNWVCKNNKTNAVGKLRKVVVLGWLLWVPGSKSYLKMYWVVQSGVI